MNYLRQLQLRRHYYQADGGGGAPADPVPPAPTTEPAPTTAPEKALEDKPAVKVDFGTLLKDKGFQSELDKYVGKALGTAKANWEQEAQTRIDEARTEGEKLAKMSAEERASTEAKKREKALADREAEITRRELRATATDELVKRGLPAVLADALVYADAEACNTSIEAVDKAFRTAVQAGVEVRLRNPDIPKGGGSSPDAAYAAQMRAAAGLPPQK